MKTAMQLAALFLLGAAVFAPTAEAHGRREPRPDSRSVLVSTHASSAEASERTVHQAVRKRMSAVQGCYDMARRMNAVEGGRLTVELEVTAAGAPSSVRIEDDTIGDVFLASCVTGVFERLRTAPLSLERVALSYPLVFAGS